MEAMHLISIADVEFAVGNGGIVNVDTNVSWAGSAFTSAITPFSCRE
jgi:hypothetical protein